MILCTIILFKVRNLILGASMDYVSHRKIKDYIPHNFGPKCSLSPSEPIFMQFFSHLMPLGAKTDPLHQYHFHFYMSGPLYTIKFQGYFSFLYTLFLKPVWYKPIKTICVPSVEQTSAFTMKFRCFAALRP